MAVTVIFALNGSLFASLFARLPAVQERTGLGDGALGLALLGAMLGLLVSQPLAGALVARLGSRPLVVAGAIGYAVGLVPIALAESFAALVVALALTGFCGGLLDVSMNVHGLTVERRLGRPVLSTMHAAFSFGALGGAAFGGLMAGAGVALLPHLAAVAVAGLAVVAVATRLLLPADSDAAPAGPMFAVPSGALLLVGLFAFCVALSEGAVADWAAIYLDRDVGTGQATAAAGLAAFSLTMGIGRLAGDRLTRALGPVRLARAGGTLAAAGMGTALITQTPAVALVGFAVAGLGLSALFPLALRTAAQRGAAAGPAVAAVSSLGYVGFLAGPPSIGGLSELAGLRSALVLLVALTLVAAALGPVLSTRSAPRGQANLSSG